MFGRHPEGYEAIVEAADAARADGEIGMLQHWRIKQQCKNEECCRQVREAIAEEAGRSGKALPKSGNGSVDWNAILDFIKQLIPLILQLVSLFKP